MVTVADLLTLVDIDLGNAGFAACPLGHAGSDGAVSVDEIVRAVVNSLDGCP